MNQFSKKIMTVILGSMLMGLGIATMLKSGIGADPLSVLNEGLGKTFNISVGTASISLMFVLVCIIFFVDRKRIGWGTVLNGLLVGVALDMFMSLNYGSDILIINLLLFLVGCMTSASGVGIYIYANLGEGGVDALMVLLTKRLNKELKVVRITMDIIILVLGGLLGGTIGIGTIIAMILTGPIIQKVMKLLNRYSLQE